MMDAERLRRIKENIAKHEERKRTQNIMGDIDSSKLDRSNTNYNRNDAAFEMAKQHYQNSYVPKKAQEYYKGVENYRNSYEQMANKPSANNYTVMTPKNEAANLISDGINTYVSPQMREQAQKHYDEVFNNENKKYAEQYARLNEKSKPAYSYAQAKSEAAKKVDNSVNAFSSQFKDENEYNAYADNMAQAKEQQRLLNYNVAEARNKLLTMKALNMNPSVKVEDTDEYKRIESDMKKAESVQEFAKNMQNEDFRKQYAEYEQHQKDYENKSWFGKAVEQVGDAIAGSIYNTGEGMYTAFIEPVTNAADYFIGRNPYEEGTLSNKIHSFYNYVHDEADRRERFSGYAQQGLTTDLYNATGNEEFSKFTSGVITTTLDAVAEAGLSMAVAALSGGTSLAAKGIQTTVGLTKAQKVAQTASSMLKGMTKDLNFWTSFAREGGSAYNDAIAAGASNEEATIAMLATGLPNAYIEVGGGVEKFKDLAGTGIKGWLRDFAKSTGEEATEELKQGIISELVKKMTYAPETELFSTADDGSGIINPIRMYQEAFGGAVGGAFGGSVGKVINVANYTVANNMYKSDSMRELIQSGKYTEMLKALPDSDFKNSEISKTFSSEMDKEQTLAKLKGISNKQLIKQYDSMIDALSSVSEGNVASLAFIATGDMKTATEVAPVLRKLYDGETITEEEAKVIADNEKIKEMLSETTGLDMTNSSWEDFVTLSEQAQFENMTGTSTGNAVADVVLGNARRAEAGRNYIAESQNRYANDLSGTPTFTAQIGDESAKITGINHIENGEVYVNLSNGTTQEAQSLNTDEVTTALLSYASEYDEKTASAFVDGYTGNISVDEYARSFAEINSAARTGLSYENIAKIAPVMVENIGKNTAITITKTGNAYALEQAKADIANTAAAQQNQAIRNDNISIENKTGGTATREHRVLARTVSKVTGYTVVLVDSSNANNGKTVNGRKAIGEFNSTKGEIVLDIGSDNVVATALHEVTHYAKINAPTQYNALRDAVLEHTTKSGKMKYYLEKYSNTYRTNNVYEITEEMTADAAEALLTNEKFIDELFNDKDFINAVVGNNKGFVRKFLDTLHDIINSIKDYLKGRTVNHQIARELSEDVKALEKIEKLWRDALKAAVDNHAESSAAKQDTKKSADMSGKKYSIIDEITDTDGNKYNNVVKLNNDIRYSLADGKGEKYSINEDIQKQFEKDVDDVINLRYNSSSPLILGVTPAILQEIGLNALPIAITKNHVYSIAVDDAQAKKDGRYKKGTNYHGLGATAVKEIYEKISNPIAVIAADNSKYISQRVIAFVDLSINGKQVIAPIEVDAEISQGSDSIDANLIVSYYDKNNISNMLSKALALEANNQVGFYYLDKKRAQSLLVPLGLQLPPQPNNVGSNIIIRHISSNVNRKIDTVLKSRQFIRWFGDWQNSPETASKVVNDDGTPRVMYHQTGARFTVFNTDNEVAGKFDSDTPVGMFFKSTEKDIGVSGNKQMKVYLNARNVLEFSNRNDIHSYWMKNVEGYSELQKEYDDVDSRFKKEYNDAEEIGDRWYEEHYDDMISGKITDEEAEEAINGELDKILDRWKKATEPLCRKMKMLITEYIRNSEYDGIHLKYDGSRNGVDVETYIVFNPNQIKSVTDNIGTFNYNDDDIRYSISEQTTAEYEMLKLENSDLKAQVEALKKEMELTGRHTVDSETVNKLARRYIREYKSKADVAEVSAKLKQIFDYVATEDANAEEANKAMYELASQMINKSETLNTEMRDTYKDVLDMIRKSKIYVDDTTKSEIEYLYGDYNTFRKSMFGRMKLTTNRESHGQTVDMLVQELAELAPGQFETNVSEGDALEQLVDFIEATKPRVENPFGDSVAEAASDLAAQMFDDYFDTPEIKTFADKYEAKLQKVINENRVARAELRKAERAKAKAFYDDKLKALRDEKNEAIAKLRKEKNDKYDNDIKDLRDAKDKKLKEVRADRDDKLKALREYYKEQQENKREKAAENGLRARITVEYKKLYRDLMTNSKEHHIPEIYKDTVANVLASIDLVSKASKNKEAKTGELTKAAEKLNNQLTELENFILNHSMYGSKDDGTNSEQLYNFDPDLASNIEKLKEYYKNYAQNGTKAVSDMSVEELRALHDTLKALRYAVKTADKALSANITQRITELAESSISEMATDKTRNPFNKNKAMEAVGALDTYINSQMLDARSYYRGMGDSATEIYKAFRSGLNTYISHIHEIQDYFVKAREESGLSEKQFKRLSTEYKTYEVSHGKITMSKAQLMSLYCLSKREQALEHIYKGGIRPTDLKGKRQVRPTFVSPEEVAELCKNLNSTELAMANKLQQFMATTCAKWGNEVSMAMYGYAKFTEKNYFPIKSSDTKLRTNDQNSGGDTGLYSVLNYGMTKSLVKNANNSIDIGDIFDVTRQHVEEMSSYSAYAGAVADGMRWFNYNNRETGESIKQSMLNKFGTNGSKYFIELVRDINRNKPTGNYGGEISSLLTSAQKAAAIAGNLSVVIQQPTAIARACTELTPDLIAKGIAKATSHPIKSAEEAQTHSEIAWWKSQGFFETNMGKSMDEIITGRSTAKDKLVELTMKPAGIADDLTWGAIWEATKQWTKKFHSEVEIGSDEFFNITKEKFDDVVDQTQVVDSVLHRPMILRSKNALVKMDMSFMAEPLKSANLLRNAIVDVKNKKPNATKRLIRVYASCVMSNVLAAAAKAIVMAFRDTGDDEWLEKWLESFTDDLLSTLNPLSIIPFVKDIFTLLDGYDVDRMDMSAISGLIKFGQQMVVSAQNGTLDTSLNLQSVYKLTRYLSQLTGVPVYNVLREVDTIVDIFGEPIFRASQATPDTERYEALYNAVMKNDEAEMQNEYDRLGKTQKEVEQRLKSKIIDDSKGNKMFNEDVDKAAKARINGDVKTAVAIVRNLADTTALSKDFWTACVNARVNKISKAQENRIKLIEAGISKLTVDNMSDTEVNEALKSYETEADTSTASDLNEDTNTESLYTADDLVKALQNGNESDYNTSYDDMVSTKAVSLIMQAEADNKELTANEAEEKAENSIKSAIAKVLKPLMRELYKTDKKRFNEMRKKIIKKFGYSFKQISKWLTSDEE